MREKNFVNTYEETRKALKEVDANQSEIGALNEQASEEMVSSNSERSFRPDMVSSGPDKVKEPEHPKEVESVADKVADKVDTVDEVVEKIKEPVVESNAVESDSLSEPDKNDEKITDEKLLKHIGRRGKVLRSVLMNSPKRSSKTFNPGDRCMLKSGHKTFRRNAKFIRRSTIPDEDQEVNPLEESRRSGGRKHPPFEAKLIT